MQHTDADRVGRQGRFDIQPDDPVLWLKIPATIRIDLRGALPAHVHPKDIILKVLGDLGAEGATYMALEFGGPGAAAISNAGRFTMCNMAIEAGAKTGIFVPDAVTAGYFGERKPSGVWFRSDPDAEYVRTMVVDLDRLVPQVSFPWSVDQVVPVDQVQSILPFRANQPYFGPFYSMALGAYFAAYTSVNWGWPAWLIIIAAIAFCILFSLVPAFKLAGLGGFPMLIATLALIEEFKP